MSLTRRHLFKACAALGALLVGLKPKRLKWRSHRNAGLTWTDEEVCINDPSVYDEPVTYNGVPVEQANLGPRYYFVSKEAIDNARANGVEVVETVVEHKS